MRNAICTIVAVLFIIAAPAIAIAEAVVFQDDFEQGAKTPSPVIGSYRVFDNQVVKANENNHPASPRGGNRIVEINRSQGAAQNAVARFVRPVRNGEHLRLELDVRLDHGDHFQFGLGSDENSITVSLRQDGAVAVLKEAGFETIAGLAHVPGEWRHCRIDYVVGSEQILLTIGDRDTIYRGGTRTDQQVAVHGPFGGGLSRLSDVDAVFVVGGDAATRGYVDNLLATVVLDPRLRDLPVFGGIEWEMRDLPFIAPGPRGGISGAAMVEVDGRIYLMGGFIPAGDETDDPSRRTSRWAHRYDPAADRWHQLTSMPGRREYTRAIVADHTVFVLGGGSQRPHMSHADVFAMDVSSKSPVWKPAPSLSVPRTHMAVGKIGDYLIVAGGNQYDAEVRGYHSTTIRSITEVLDLKNPSTGWKQVSPIPGLARGWCASAVVGGRLYLLGGLTWTQDDQGRERRSRVQETLSYDPEQNVWKQHAPPPVPTSGWEGAVYRDRYIIVVGGIIENEGRPGYTWNAQPLVYDTQDDRWMMLECSVLPPGGVYNDPGVVVIGDDIYVAGGEALRAHYNHFLVGRIQPASRIQGASAAE